MEHKVGMKITKWEYLEFGRRYKVSIIGRDEETEVIEAEYRDTDYDEFHDWIQLLFWETFLSNGKEFNQVVRVYEEEFIEAIVLE